MTEDALLDSLGAAFAPPGAPIGPSAASLHDLHRAIATSPAFAPSRPRPVHLLPALAATVGACAAAVATVLVTSSPHIERQTATRATTAATTFAFGEVTQHRVALATALADEDVSTVIEEASALRSAVIGLPARQWVLIRFQVGALLMRAETFIAYRGTSTVDPTTTTSTTLSTTTFDDFTAGAAFP